MTSNRLAEVPEAQASSRILEIYEDIKATLAVPTVNLIYRYMAIYPEYLEAAWRELRPNLRTVYVSQAADRIRAEARLELLPLSKAALNVVGVGTSQWEDFRQTMQVYNDVNPKGIMVVTALLFGAGRPACGQA